MNNLIVTSGQKYTDIDVLASALAYREIEEEAIVILPGPLNLSVTPTIRNWPLKFESKILDGNHDYVIVDMSNPDLIREVAPLDRVVEIFEHHFGYEKYWQEKLGPKAHIESIGACATLVWEEFKKKQPTKTA